MPHRDTKVAIKQAINRALNATPGHKHNYKQANNRALNVTQGHKSCYQKSY